MQTTKKAPIKVVDLSDSCASPVVVRGMVIGGDDKEPLIGASVVIDGTNKGVATNIDGLFALKLPSETSLVISYIGYKKQKVHVSSLLRPENNVIILKSDGRQLTGEVVTVVKTVYNDDVYDRRTYKVKSHKEKTKKCK